VPAFRQPINQLLDAPLAFGGLVTDVAIDVVSAARSIRYQSLPPSGVVFVNNGDTLRVHPWAPHTADRSVGFWLA